MDMSQVITCKTVPGRMRMRHVDKLFGINFPMRLEPVVYSFADKLCSEYKGGYWDFFELSNGGFYMAPQSDNRFHLSSPNGFVCELSADSTGLVCCLFCFSMLSFEGDEFAELCAEHYHLLREYAFSHPESAAIFQAID